MKPTLAADSGLPRAFFSPYSQDKYRFFMTKGNLLNRITLRTPRVILSRAPAQPVCTQPK